MRKTNAAEGEQLELGLLAPLPAFDPTQAHVWLVNISGGKDSQVTLDEVARLRTRLGFTGTVVVVHCDLGRAEWAGTGELAEAHAKHYGFRFIKVARPKGDLLQQIDERGMFPGFKTRFCTSDQKRDQVQKVITMLHREWVADGHKGEHFELLNVMGLRADEGDRRRKMAPVAVNGRAGCNTRTVTDWLPIHDWTADDVWARIKTTGVPYHPAYDLGMDRLSCVFCLYAPKAALMIAGKANPELLGEYIELEEKIGHTLKKDMPLTVVRDAIAAGEAPGEMGDWGNL